jgi:hypothetical protein
MTRILSIAAAVAVMIAALGSFTTSAAAHDRRNVGPYTFVVGWIAEPAFAGQLNALDLRVSETSTTKAVDGLEKTLKAEVVAGGGSAVMPLAIAARFGVPGAYQAQVVPTRIGDYTFHITGTVGTTTVDEKFESGPGRFDPVEDLTPLQFPSKVPSAAELAATLDDVTTKLTVAIAIAAIALVLSLASFARALRRR